MDAERFGRALGRGVRAAATALVEAADAAAAPARPPKVRPLPRFQQAASTRARQNPSARDRPQSATPRQSRPAGLRQGSRRFGQAVWAPAARAGSVLWHEVTGSFFALFAFAAGLEVWKHRGELLVRGAAAGGRVWFAVAMLAIFGWFTVSSFAKARQRSRR